MISVQKSIQHSAWHKEVLSEFILITAIIREKKGLKMIPYQLGPGLAFQSCSPHPLFGECFSKCGLQSTNSSIIHQLGRNANSQTHGWSSTLELGSAIYILTKALLSDSVIRSVRITNLNAHFLQSELLTQSSASQSINYRQSLSLELIIQPQVS